MAPCWVQRVVLQLVIFATAVVLGNDEFEGQSTIVLEHTFDSGYDAVFTRRGTVTIRSLKQGVAQYSSDGTLSDHQLDDLKHLVREDGHYRVRVASPQTDAEGNPIYVSTFIKACLLYEAQLTEAVTINVDQSGNILGLSLMTPVAYCLGKEQDDEDLVSFKTSIDVVQTVAGPAPETATHVKRMEQEKAEKAKGQQADNRSFFAKYWMYLVPLFIFMMLASNADPGQGGGGGGGQ